MYYSRTTHIFSLIIVLYLCIPLEAGRIAKFKHVSSRFSPKYYHNFTMFAENNKVFADFYVTKRITPGFKANLEFQLRLKNSKNFQTLFAYTLDVCKVVVKFKDNLFKKWFQSLLKVGNFMPSCPVNNGHYYLNGWQMESNMVPMYLLPGDYRIIGYCYNGKFKTKSEDFVLKFEAETLIEDV